MSKTKLHFVPLTEEEIDFIVMGLKDNAEACKERQSQCFLTEDKELELAVYWDNLELANRLQRAYLSHLKI